MYLTLLRGNTAAANAANRGEGGDGEGDGDPLGLRVGGLEEWVANTMHTIEVLHQPWPPMQGGGYTMHTIEVLHQPWPRPNPNLDCGPK